MTNKRIIITESQKDFLIEQLLFEKSIMEVDSLEDLKDIIKRAIRKGVIISMATISMICGYYHLNSEQENELKSLVNIENQQENDWTLAADDVLATVYNAVPSQCNRDVKHTASMFNLNLNNVLSHRIIAMERTFMKELGLKYGDVVKIEGTGQYDGEWQIQDTMNKRFAGQHKIDILVPNNIKRGKWDNVKLYVLSDKTKTEKYREKFAQQVKK